MSRVASASPARFGEDIGTSGSMVLDVRRADYRSAESPLAAAWRRIVPLLPWPFMVLGSAVLMSSGVFGGFAMDAHIYYRGAAAWLAGTDPWLASYMVNSYSYHFAALPWALPFVAPLTLLPEDVAAPLMVVLSTAAAAVILRRSGLSIWWLLFPPLSQGVFNGNPIVICTALILLNSPIALLIRPQLGWAVVGEKRWRTIVLTSLLAVLLLAFSPVRTFTDDLHLITATYAVESFGGTSGGTVMALVIGVGAVLVIAIRNPRAAGWLATIVAWPLSGWYSGVAALPIMTPLLAIGLAMIVIGLPIWTVVAFALAPLLIEHIPGTGWLRPFVQPSAGTSSSTADPATRALVPQPAATSLRRTVRAPSS